ncbi:MAG TPA: methyltransferase domain-containing protein [Steroidobacteraceae bacterium]|jgi:SAM-dependent methyltransferase|nr:methyltransferase domain-containing protein [Steroidobacteraceae bacterium]
MSRPTERFSARVESYRRYRPGYPAGAIALLAAQCGLTAGAVVADVGSGTGILSGQLLERGALVLGIEPNDAMRAAAEERLGAHPRFRSVAAAAEATTLPDESVDLWVAAQAFHWFDAPRARLEALRVVRNGAFAALLWNERPGEPGEFLTEYEALLRRHATEYTAIVARRVDEPRMREFLGGAMRVERFPNEQTLDYAGLEGRLLSSSYTPEPGHPEYQPMLAALRALFERYQRNGAIVFPYETRVYFAQLKPHG